MNNIKIACRTAAVAALLLGATGLAGWFFDSEALKCIIHGWVSMKANTAALLVLCGAALLLICAQPGAPYYALRKRVAYLLAAVAVLVGFLTILDYVYGFNFGLDQVLFSENAGAAFAKHPGRMAAATALCFILTGLGLLLLDRGVKRRTFSISEKCALAVLLTAFHSLIGYFYGLASGTLSNLYTPMAPHTAVAFMFLGIGMTLARPGGFVLILSVPGIPRRLVQLTLPTAFIVPAAFGWLRLLGEKRGFYDGSSGVALTSIFSTAALTAVILYAVKVVRKMGEDLAVTQFSVDNAGDAVIWSGPDGRVLYANKAASALLGYTREELLGLSVTEISTVYKTESWEAHWAALKEKGAHKYETELLAKDGHLTLVEVNSNYLNLEGREYKCVYARDLAARRQAQQALRESEEGLRFAMEVAEMGHWSLDLTDSTARRSLKHDQIFGYETLLPQWTFEMFLEHVLPEDRAEVAKKFQQAVNTRSDWNFECRINRRDGAQRWILARGRHRLNNSGQATIMEGIVQDITWRKKTEAALQKSEQRLAAAQELAHLGSWELDLPDNRLVWSDEVYRIFGLEPREFSASYEAFLEAVHPDDRAAVDAAYSESLREGRESYEIEHRVVRGGTGEVRIVHEKCHHVRDGLGRVVKSIGMVQDITERRKAETELLKATREAEAANRAKRDFLSKMSHEIRTPLNAILGFSQLMRRDPEATGTQQQRLDIINRSGEHLLELINEVLEISRIESGRLTPHKEAFDLHNMLEDLERMFKAKAEAKGLRLELEILKGEQKFFFGDHGKLRQVISNILSNAVKFTAHGGVSLRVRAKGLGGARFRVEAEVQDSGPGMTPEETAALFRPFGQTQAGRKEGSGTGLGLAISREYAKLMGGGVEVASRPGEGSTFKISVIMEEASKADIVVAPALQHVKALKQGQPPCRVLIADDKEDNRTFLSELLGSVGFEIRAVADGAQALKEFEAWLPQIILMDLRMPGMDGHEAIKRLRAMEKGKEVKIIAVSASAFTEVQQEARASGADEFIAKPFRESELFEKIGKLTGVQYVYGEQPGPAPTPVEETLTAELFAGCPSALLNRIRSAALDCDFDAITGLADQVEPVNLKAARGLRALAQKYDHKGILGAVPEGKP